MGGAGSGAHIGQVRPHEAAGSKPCVPRSPGGGAAAHGRGAAVRELVPHNGRRSRRGFWLMLPGRSIHLLG